MPFTHWDTLVGRIKDKKCTPFIGAGASAGVFPLGAGLAKQLAKEFNYPLPDSDDLARVAEFIAVTRKDGMVPKERIRDILQSLAPPAQQPTSKIYRVLAGLRLPIYLTSNYDELMYNALVEGDRRANREVCRWNKLLLEQQPSAFDAGYEPASDNPVVFHLHGRSVIPESMVVTEDDYLDFLVNISKDIALNEPKKALPLNIRNAIRNTTLLFVGYRVADLNFRVILRGLLSSLEQSTRRINITVQLPPDTGNPEKEVKEAQEYFEQYFDWMLSLQVYWGPADDFALQLQQRLGGLVESSATSAGGR